MAKKIILEDSQGNVLHPKTLGECVTTETGETVDGLVSKSQMFSPIIETDSSMSKVGVGTDIDVSLNVKDGAYEECVFEGRSLVNLFSRVSHAVGIWGREDSSSSLLKPNTRYTVSIQKLPPNCQWTLTIDVNGVSTMMFPYLNSSNKIAFDTLENVGTVMMIHLNDGGTTEITKDMIDEMKPMVIEGDYTKVDIPYFIGLCDVKMPILRNVGKNLFDKQRHSNPNNFVVNPSYWSIPIQLKGNTLYNFSYTYDNVHNKQTVLRFATDIWTNPTHSSSPYNLVEVFNTSITSNLMGERGNARFTTPANGLVYLHYYNGELGNSLSSFNIMSWYTHLLKDVQLEEAPSATSYEDHKTNILRTSEEIVLRSVGDIKDSYNALTGEYTKRIGEITFNGSENEWEDWNENSFVLRGSYFSDAIEHSSSTAPRLKCNNMVAGLGETPRTVRYYKTPTVLWTMVGKNDGETLDQFKQWLSQNPATIQYILAEPVTTIVKPSTTTPFAYQNGHVIVESGHEGQSLFPHLKYSVVTGRTGQVTQNTKVLRKQEQQIIGLEELLLTQIVQMEYERTLLQFDYELQMMMLG